MLPLGCAEFSWRKALRTDFLQWQTNINGTHYLLPRFRELQPSVGFILRGSSEMFRKGPRDASTGKQHRSILEVHMVSVKSRILPHNELSRSLRSFLRAVEFFSITKVLDAESKFVTRKNHPYSGTHFEGSRTGTAPWKSRSKGAIGAMRESMSERCTDAPNRKSRATSSSQLEKHTLFESFASLHQRGGLDYNKYVKVDELFYRPAGS